MFPYVPYEFIVVWEVLYIYIYIYIYYYTYPIRKTQLDVYDFPLALGQKHFWAQP